MSDADTVDADDGGAEYVTPTRASLRRRLQRMDSERFEHLVVDVWARLGWDTRVVGAPGDRGIDVILVDGEALLGPIETLDGWAVVATYFDDLERREHDDRGVGRFDRSRGRRHVAPAAAPRRGRVAVFLSAGDRRRDRRGDVAILPNNLPPTRVFVW